MRNQGPPSVYPPPPTAAKVTRPFYSTPKKVPRQATVIPPKNKAEQTQVTSAFSPALSIFILSAHQQQPGALESSFVAIPVTANQRL